MNLSDLWDEFMGKKKRHHKPQAQKPKEQYSSTGQLLLPGDANFNKGNKKHKKHTYYSRKATPEQVSAVAQDIFGGSYFCVGDPEDT